MAKQLTAEVGQARALIWVRRTDFVSQKVYSAVKRSVDIFGGTIGVLLLIPITVMVKVAMLCMGDYHTMFFVQERIGKDGKTFKLYKFRSMIVGAEDELEGMLRSDKKLAREYKKMKKLVNDPRVTRVGRILRKTSVDELPQLINVLKGDMSFVGNRPYLPREKTEMLRYYDDIIKTRPGLSGYWQVSLRSRGTFGERLKMESYYSKHCSLGLDLKILAKTIGVVLRMKGAE